MSTAEPKARPMLFSGPLVRAILAGQKTVTRRLVKEPRWARPGTFEAEGDTLVAVSKKTGCLATVACRYGAPGDRLWVRETFAAYSIAPRTGVETHWRRMTPEQRRTWARSGVRYRATPEAGLRVKDETWIPAIHMPRGVSRVTLEIASVRAERLHALTEQDAAAEGTEHYWNALDERAARQFGNRWTEYARRYGYEKHAPDWRGAFAALWDAINGKRAPWASNPWVWRVEFKRVTL